MPQPLSMAIRQSIVQRYNKGESVSILARAFQVSRTTIYSLLKRFDLIGSEGLRPHYNKCGKARPDGKSYIYRAVRCMRTWHPGWGAEKIWAEMQHMRPNLELPHHRTFTRWFHWNKQITVPIKSDLPESKSKRANRLHEGWQIDAKEEMTISDGSKNSWLNITDEFSGTVIDPCVFPPQKD